MSKSITNYKVNCIVATLSIVLCLGMVAYIRIAKYRSYILGNFRGLAGRLLKFFANKFSRMHGRQGKKWSHACI